MAISASESPPIRIDATPPESPREPFGQQIPVVIGSGRRDRIADLSPPVLDGGFVAGALDQQSLVARDHRAAGAPQDAGTGIPQGKPLVLGDDGGTGQHRGVFQRRPAPVAEMRRLGGDKAESAADLVRSQRSERLAFHRLGDDRQRAAHADGNFQQPQQRLVAVEPAVVEQDQRFFVGAEQGFPDRS